MARVSSLATLSPSIHPKFFRLLPKLIFLVSLLSVLLSSRMSPFDLGYCASDDDCDLLSLFLGDDLPQLAPDPPCDLASTSSQGTKRKSNDNEQLGESSMHGTVASRKRPRVDGNFSCPYRRRNPRVFNVRDFPTCAQNSFSSITLVK